MFRLGSATQERAVIIVCRALIYILFTKATAFPGAREGHKKKGEKKKNRKSKERRRAKGGEKVVSQIED